MCQLAGQEICDTLIGWLYRNLHVLIGQSGRRLMRADWPGTQEPVGADWQEIWRVLGADWPGRQGSRVLIGRCAGPTGC